MLPHRIWVSEAGQTAMLFLLTSVTYCCLKCHHSLWLFPIDPRWLVCWLLSAFSRFLNELTVTICWIEVHRPSVVKTMTTISIVRNVTKQSIMKLREDGKSVTAISQTLAIAKPFWMFWKSINCSTNKWVIQGQKLESWRLIKSICRFRGDCNPLKKYKYSRWGCGETIRKRMQTFVHVCRSHQYHLQHFRSYRLSLSRYNLKYKQGTVVASTGDCLAPLFSTLLTSLIPHCSQALIHVFASTRMSINTAVMLAWICRDI